jgi:Cu(I)/Ag(I) efflux system membrane fusion protein
MKKTSPIALALLTFAFLASRRGVAAAAEASAQLGDLTVKLVSTPEPPRTGDNQLTVALQDASGRPVEGARLGFIWDMPAMGVMPEMKGTGKTSGGGAGRYVVTYPLAMQGDWYLTLAIDAPGHAHQELKMKVATGRPGIAIEPSAPSGESSGISVSSERRQLIGVKLAVAERRPLAVTMRAAGRVAVDERNVSDVTLKYEAFVQKVHVGETGKTVRRGQPLCLVYSPDLLSAEEELLAARRSGASGALTVGLERRLASWDLSPAQIQAVENAGKADGRLTIPAPASGVVLEKSIVEGARVEAGTTLYRIGNLGRVWIQAAIAERDAGLVSVGQPAQVRVGAISDPLAARVTFVAPTVDEKTHTIGARLELANPRLALKPGMFAEVAIDAPLGPRLAVPDSAVLRSGEHHYVFVDRGGGTFQPVEVQVGALAGDYVEVREGLSVGERVATGATFLLSSEAKLRDALPRWRSR